METVGASSHNRQQLSNHSDDSDAALIPSNSVEIEPENYPKWRKITTVAILCFINLINYMDRFTLAGILTDIKDDFDIGDDKVGLLQTVFVISYMIFAPLFGYLGDRQSRTKIMAAGIFLWSITTLIGSFMTNFWWFLFFRALVGIGEASYSTIAPTIISDLFVKDMRSKMLAVFYFAIPVGSGLGYIVGSEAAKAFGSWQWGLRVTPLLGTVAVVLMQVVMRDPQRGQAEGGTHVSTGSYKDDIKALAKNTSFMLSTAGFTCVAFVAGALAWWGPQFIFLGLKLQPENNGNVTFSDVSLTFGVIAMTAGIIGVPLGTTIGDGLIKRFPFIHPIICGVGMFLSAGFFLLAILLVETQTVAPLVLMFFGQLALNLNWAIVADMLLYVVIPTRRSTAEAFQILVSHAFGDAGSPYLVGVISEALKIYLLPVQTKSINNYSLDNSTVITKVYEDDRVNFKALQYALFTTSFVEVVGGALFLVTALYIVKDKMRVEKVVSDSSVQPTHHFAEDIERHPRVVNINL